MDLNEIKRSAHMLKGFDCNRNNNVPFAKPISLSTPPRCKYVEKRNALKTISSAGDVRPYQQKGIIFEWPQRRKYYSEKELSFYIWILAHALFWLHITNMWPNGTALALNQPPWKYKVPLPKPENRDYIIEPDWDSCYL